MIKRVAIISDGSAFTSSGNADISVIYSYLEDKAFALEEQAKIKAVPISLASQDLDESLSTILNISHNFAALVLCGLSSEHHIAIEKGLAGNLSTPIIFEEDFSLSIAAIAAIINTYKYLRKDFKDIKAVINGDGSKAGAVLKMLVDIGIKDIIMCDDKGVISIDRLSEFDEFQIGLLELTNKSNLSGGLEEALFDSNIYIGAGSKRPITENMLKTMNRDSAIILLESACNEITSSMARRAGVKIFASCKKNDLNFLDSSLVLPGVLRGIANLQAGTEDNKRSIKGDISFKIKNKLAYALASCVKDKDLGKDCIMPKVSDNQVPEVLAKTVANIYGDKNNYEGIQIELDIDINLDSGDMKNGGNDMVKKPNDNVSYKDFEEKKPEKCVVCDDISHETLQEVDKGEPMPYSVKSSDIKGKKLDDSISYGSFEEEREEAEATLKKKSTSSDGLACEADISLGEGTGYDNFERRTGGEFCKEDTSYEAVEDSRHSKDMPYRMGKGEEGEDLSKFDSYESFESKE